MPFPLVGTARHIYCSIKSRSLKEIFSQIFMIFGLNAPIFKQKKRLWLTKFVLLHCENLSRPVLCFLIYFLFISFAIMTTIFQPNWQNLFHFVKILLPTKSTQRKFFRFLWESLCNLNSFWHCWWERMRWRGKFESAIGQITERSRKRLFICRQIAHFCIFLFSAFSLAFIFLLKTHFYGT